MVITLSFYTLILKLQNVSWRNGYLSVGCQEVQHETCGSDGVHYHDHSLLEVTPCSLLDRVDEATSVSTIILIFVVPCIMLYSGK